MDNFASIINCKSLEAPQRNDEGQCGKQVFNQKHLKSCGGNSPMLNTTDQSSKRKDPVDFQCLHQSQAHMPSPPASQKRFFFVDRVGGKNTIYLHSSMLKNFSPGLHRNAMSDLHAIFEHVIPPDLLPTTELVFLDEGDCEKSTEKAMMFKRIMTSASGALHEMLSSKERRSFLDEMRSKSGSFVINSEAQCKGGSGWNMDDLASNDTSYSSLVEDSDDLEALLDSDDEVNSHGVINSDDEMSTGQSPAYVLWSTECGRAYNAQNIWIQERHIRKNNCDFEDSDEESMIMPVVNSAMACSTYKLANVPSVVFVPGSASTEQFPENWNCASSSQHSDQSGGIQCLSAEIAQSSNVKRKRLVQETCVSGGSAKKPSHPYMEKLPLMQSVIPVAAACSDDVLDETASHTTSL